MSVDDRGARQLSQSHRHRDLRTQHRRSIGLTALALIPGAGLTQTRYRRLGWVLLTIFVLGLVSLALVVTIRGASSTALLVAVNPDLLLAIAGVAVGGGLVWIVSIVLTHRGSEPSNADGASRFRLRLFTGLLCLVVAAPTVQLVRYASIQRDVVGTLFAGGGRTPMNGNPAAAKPNNTTQDPWRGVPRVNMLLIGSDAGTDRTGVRTDSMVVASTDTKTGNTTLIGIPRSLQRVPFPASNPLHQMYPNGYYCPNAKPGDECLINAVWTLAEDNKHLFKGDDHPGLTTITGVIGEVTGLHLDYSTVIDLAGFQALVDAMGGVWVNVTERLPINGYHVGAGTQIDGVEGWIEPGYQHLDGQKALWYARSRLTTDDYSRMRRQRCLIGTILDQVNPTTMLAQYPQLAQVAKENISTDIGIDDLPAWVDLVQRVQKGSITSLAFTDENINTVRPNFDRMRELVQAAINPPTPPTSTPPTSSAAATHSSGTSTTRTPDGNTPVNVREAC